MSLTFAPPVAAWVGLAVLAGGVASVLVARRRLAALAVGRAARVMLGLRVAAVLALLLAFANPTLVSAVSAGHRPRVRLLLDDSRSMLVPDGARGGTRLDDLRAAAHEVSRVLDGTFTVETLAFGDAVEPVSDLKALDGHRAATDLGGTLAQAARSSGEAPVALLVVSDGIDTAGGAAAPPSCPVFAVPVGTDLARLDDVRVEAVRAPERVDLHTAAAVEVDVAAGGSAAFVGRHRSLTVTLLDGKASVGARSVALDAGGRGTARFEVRLDEAGVHALEARVDAVAGDKAPSDDRRRVFVLAEDPSLRVLFLASRVTREYGPLRAEIARTPGVRFSAAIRLAPGKTMTEGLPAGDPLSAGFPSDVRDLSAFDVVVLGPSPASDLTAAEDEALARHVEGGGGLLVLGGESALGLGGWGGRALARVLPVDLRGGEESLLAGAFRAEATPEGRASPVLEGLVDLLAPGDRGAGLSVASLHRVGSLRPGAGALLQVRLPDTTARPLLVAGSAGRGRVLVLLTNTLHRAAGGAACAALIRQAVRYLASRDAERDAFSLVADKPRYAVGETARLRATVRGADREPMPDAAVAATRLAIDGTERGAVEFRPTPEAGPGTFVADVRVEGDEPVRVKATASGPAGVVGVREALLRVACDTREGEVLAADPSRLFALAAQSGGAVVPATALGELPARLAFAAPEAPRPVETSLALDGPWLLLAFAGLLMAEWILRRRANLP